MRRSVGRSGAPASIPKQPGRAARFTSMGATGQIGSRTDPPHCTPRHRVGEDKARDWPYLSEPESSSRIVGRLSPCLRRRRFCDHLLPAWARLGPLSMQQIYGDAAYRRLIAAVTAAIARPTGRQSGFPTGWPWDFAFPDPVPRISPALRLVTEPLGGLGSDQTHDEGLSPRGASDHWRRH